MGHDENECRALDLMREHIVDAYIVQGEDGQEGGLMQYKTPRVYNKGGRGGFRGQGRGGFD